MTYHRKRPERRTFLQDRFEILIRRQRNGEATFSELTELDEIVNRDPELRERVIRESMLMEETDDYNEPSNELPVEENTFIKPVKRRNLLDRMKALISRIFTSHISAIKAGRLIICT